MAVSYRDAQKHYDDLIQLIVKELNKLFNDLWSDKEKIMRLRNTQYHKFHTEKTEYITNRRNEMEEEAGKRNHTIPTTQLTPINNLQKELGQLIIKEMDIERREAIVIKDDPARIDKEISEIKIILKYIKDTVGDRGKRRKLTKEDSEVIYNKIKDVYNSVLTRKEEADLTNKHFEPLKLEIENKSEKIIRLIDDAIDKLPKNPVAGAGPSNAVIAPSTSKDEAKYIKDTVKEAERVLKVQRGALLYSWKYLEKIRNVAISKLKPEIKLKDAQKHLKQVKWAERREQSRGSIRQLKPKLRGLTQRNSVNTKVKATITALLTQFTVLEAEWLATTESGLKVKLGVKKEDAGGINWEGVEKDIDELEKAVQSATAVDDNLKKQLDNLDESAVNIIKRKKSPPKIGGEQEPPATTRRVINLPHRRNIQ